MVPVVAAHNLENERATMIGRYGSDRLPEHPENWVQLREFVEEHKQEIFPGLQPVNRLTIKEYNAREQIPNKTKKANYKAHLEWKYGYVSVRKIVKMESFNKTENLEKMTEEGTFSLTLLCNGEPQQATDNFDEHFPRMIINVSDPARVAMGRTTVPCQDQLGSLWSVAHKFLHYDSGKTKYEDMCVYVTDAWDRHHHAIHLDMSHCDKHHSTSSHCAAEVFYQWCDVHGLPLEVIRGFYTNQRIVGRFGTGLSRDSGGLPTGSPETGLKNTLVVALLITYILCVKFHLTPGKDFCAQGKGDDWNIYCARNKVPAALLRAAMAEFGFKCKAQNVVEIEKLTFCSMLYVPATLRGRKVLAPTLTLKVLKCACSTSICFKDRVAYCRAVSKGLLAIAKFNPVVLAFMKSMEKIGNSSSKTTLTINKQALFDAELRFAYKNLPEFTGDVQPDRDGALEFLSKRYDLPRSLLVATTEQWVAETGFLGTKELSTLVAGASSVDF